jgi:hypothetical protein
MVQATWQHLHPKTALQPAAAHYSGSNQPRMRAQPCVQGYGISACLLLECFILFTVPDFACVCWVCMACRV